MKSLWSKENEFGEYERVLDTPILAMSKLVSPGLLSGILQDIPYRMHSFSPFSLSALHYTLFYLGTMRKLHNELLSYSPRLDLYKFATSMELLNMTLFPFDTEDNLKFNISRLITLDSSKGSVLALELNGNEKVQEMIQVCHERYVNLFQMCGLQLGDIKTLMESSSDLKYFAQPEKKVHHISLGIFHSREILPTNLRFEKMPDTITVYPPSLYHNYPYQQSAGNEQTSWISERD
jgi:hypothetical protein